MLLRVDDGRERESSIERFLRVSQGWRIGRPGVIRRFWASFRARFLGLFGFGRPEFALDMMDDVAEPNAFWMMADDALEAGISLPDMLRSEGWSEKDLAEIFGKDS
jgi:hypothetical protein